MIDDLFRTTRVLEKIITFESQYKDFLLKPVPIKKLVPDWYKKLSNYTDDKLNYQNPTAKNACHY